MKTGNQWVVAAAAVVIGFSMLTDMAVAGQEKGAAQGKGAALGTKTRDRLKDGTCLTPTVSATATTAATKTKARLKDGSCLTK